MNAINSVYSFLNRNISDILGSRRVQAAEQEEQTPEGKQHGTPFLIEVNNCIEYASRHKSELSCIFVDFRDEYALPEFFDLLVGAYHGNNGLYPSNEIRRVGKGQIGALIHAPADEVGAALEEIVRQFAELLPVNSNIKFKAGIAAYKPGDTRSALMKRAQYFVGIDLPKSDKPQPQENYEELMKLYGPEATAKRMGIPYNNKVAVA